MLSLLSACKKDDKIIQNNNWKTIYQNNDLYLYSINFIDKDNGFVMADSSGVHGISGWKFVLSTKDGGNTWNQVTCSTNDNVNQFPLYDIGFVYPISQNVLLTTGYQVHKSNDTGKTWINVSPQLVGASINNLYVIDSLTWLVAKGNYILEQIMEVNPGRQFFKQILLALWKTSLSFSYIGYVNIGVFDIDHNADVGLIIKTTDKGQTWTTLAPEPWKSNGILIPYLSSLQFVTDQIGYVSTLWDYKLFKTINGGDNWTLVSNKNIVNGLEYFISENLGYCSDGNTIMLQTMAGRLGR